jgi:hypothetical protein
VLSACHWKKNCVLTFLGFDQRIGRHASGVADPFNGHIDEFRIAPVQRPDGWIKTIWNSMSDPGAFAVAGAEKQEGGMASRHRSQALAWSSA